MIREDYVNVETAKLLKEKGFEGDTSCYYIQGNAKRWVYQHYHDFDKKDRIECPTLQMAMKWLRDIFHLEIYPFHDAIQENNDWWYRIEQHFKGCDLIKHESDVIYKTYEEACEAAIKYCLENLI